MRAPAVRASDLPRCFFLSSFVTPLGTADMNRTLFAAFTAAFVALPAQAQIVRPFLTTTDGTLSARIDGARCADVVRMTFVGRDADAFRTGFGAAERLMNNVTTLLRQQCPALVRVTSKGLVGTRIVYTGIAETATSWEVVELGAGTGSGLLAGASAAPAAAGGGPLPRDLFGREQAFVAAPKLLEWLRATPHLCVRHDAKANNCAGLNQFESQADGSVRMTASYKLDASGSTAVLTYPAQNKNGFFCSNPTEARVVVRDGTLTAAGRSDMQAMLLERVQAAGSEICTGYAGTSPQDLNTESFGAAGTSQTQRTPATLLAQRPPLRLDR